MRRTDTFLGRSQSAKHSLDIDTEFHFDMAEWLMSGGQADAVA